MINLYRSSQKIKLSSKARLRIGLSYEIIRARYKVVKKLYKNAMNRSTNNDEDRYEAAIRYVGVSYLRAFKKILLSDRNIFLEAPKALQGRIFQSNYKKLLWLTRLRTLIVSEKYDLAFDYYNNLPLEIINIEDRKVFLVIIVKLFLGKMYEISIKKIMQDVIRFFFFIGGKKKLFCPKKIISFLY